MKMLIVALATVCLLISFCAQAQNFVNFESDLVHREGGLNNHFLQLKMYSPSEETQFQLIKFGEIYLDKSLSPSPFELEREHDYSGLLMLKPQGWDLYPSPGSAVPSEMVDLADSIRHIDESAKNLISYLESDKNKACINSVEKYVYDKSRFEDYITNCDIRSLDEAEVKLELRDFIEDRVGVFVNKNKDVFCGGVLLDGKSIVTARHCFRNRSLLINSKFHLLNESASPIEGFSISNQACGSIQDFHEVRSFQPCDHLTLEINEAYHRPNLRRMKVAEGVSNFQKIFFVGYHKYMHAVKVGVGVQRLSLTKLRENIDKWRMGMVTTGNPLCSSYGVVNVVHPSAMLGASNQCFQHSCQTAAGMSGTPMFTITESNELQLLGIHIGANTLDTRNWYSNFTCGYDQALSIGSKVQNVAIKFN